MATTSDGESTTISFSNKARNGWLRTYPWPPPWKRPNGDQAHRIRSSCSEAPSYGQTYWAVSSDARRVTPPTLPELSDSAVENCHFCGRLKEIFLDQYGERSWWQDSDSWLQFWVQYEWEGCKEASGTRKYIFDAMAVLVQHPEAYPDRSDAFRFAVGAMPGNLACPDEIFIQLTICLQERVESGSSLKMIPWIQKAQCLNEILI